MFNPIDFQGKRFEVLVVSPLVVSMQAADGGLLLTTPDCGPLQLRSLNKPPRKLSILGKQRKEKYCE